MSYKKLLLGTLWSLLSFCLFAGVVEAQDFGEVVRSSEPLSPEEELKTFSFPDGFQVQLFASEPDIQKPMNMAFDDRGRLWVSGSNDYPFPDLSDSPGDSIRILEDTDLDGRADKFTTFVDNITIPMGIYPYKDGVIAFTIPNITFYRDTDGDGRSDKEEFLYGPFDYSRDTHGLNNAFRRGLDGWIYACHGFNNHSKVLGTDGNEVSLQSGNSYRFKTDGSRIEHFTHGQVNPFGMTFDTWGDLYNSDCHTLPISLLVKDGYYESFGKPHDGLGFVPSVMSHSHGSTAIAGLSQYTGKSFPEEYQNSLFVGNVMTSRVHRDVISYEGSTVKVIEQPDFLISKDSWFRPVDIQCGPDESLYIADFYNRIIGHYEIDLNHPGRDRFRGRIWRISYVGTEDRKPSVRLGDVSNLNTLKLINSLADANLPKSYHIVEKLINQTSDQDAEIIREALMETRNSRQRSHLLWVLHRMGRLAGNDLKLSFDDEEPLVQVHVQRILADTKDWTEAERALVYAGLQASPMVARAAATALAEQEDAQHLAPILNKMSTVPDVDRHLKHVLKIALRNSLRTSAGYSSLAKIKLSEVDHQSLVATSLAVQSEQSAKYLLSRIGQQDLAEPSIKKIVTLAAQHLDEQMIPELVEIVRAQFTNDIDLQIEIIKSLVEGFRQKGSKPNLLVLEWADEVIQSVLSEEFKGMNDWTSLSLSENEPLQWDLETRSTADGKRDLLFLSSLPAGEKATGILKSKSFTLPKKISFYLCGHLGYPDKELIPKNFVSLHIEENGKPIQVALAPRNDTAQIIEWDLEAFEGKKGYLQLTDGIDLPAFAWLAFYGLEPPVVQIPTSSPRLIEQRLLAVVTLINQLQFSHYEGNCRHIASQQNHSIPLRYEALRALVTHDPSPNRVALVHLFREEGLNPEQRMQISHLISMVQETDLKQLLKTLPLKDQTVYARALSNFDQGAHELLDFIKQGVISSSVLQSVAVKTQLENLQDSDLRKEFKTITDSLPDVDAELEKLIIATAESFHQGRPDIEAGKIIFHKNCSTCHSMEGVGKKIGPQLDGIGNRGLDRVLEDVLAPNRNIDIAFRSHTWLLDDGRVVSGLFRREDGELTVIANQKGEEISFASESIEAEKVSPISIMSEDWVKLIPKHDFNNLIAYLLSNRQKAVSQPN